MLDKESNAYVTVEELQGEIGIPIISSPNPSSITFAPNTLYNLGTLSGSLTVSFSGGTSGYASEYMFRFIAGSGCSVTLPSGTRYLDDTAPTFTTGKTYEFDILEGLAVVGEY